MSTPGTLSVNLDGTPSDLRCSLYAAKQINAMFGDYQGALDRLRALDLNAYIAIVAAGLGKDARDVEDKVYTTGMSDLILPLMKFVNMLGNGGRPPATDDAKATPGKNG